MQRRIKIKAKTAVKICFDVVNVLDTIYELRGGSGIGVGAPQFGQRRGFTAQSHTIFEEFKLIIGRCGGKPIVQGNGVGGARSRVSIETSCEANCSKPESRSMSCRALCIRLDWFGSTTVLFLAAAIVLMLSLSAAPNLHERLHPTAGSLHECAVTLIAFGSCHHGAAAPLLIAPITTVHLSKVPVLGLPWVESPFLAARVFEHAPPGCS